MPTDAQRVQAVFLAASEIDDPAKRGTFLDGACGDDAELRSRVGALLRAHDQPDSLLDHPVVAPHGTDSAATRTIGHDGSVAGDGDPPLAFLSPATRPDSLGRLGHYEVLQVLGQGGFGIVFRAFDDVLHRIVAVKVLSPQMAATSPARKRFLREARSSAQVRHENVVQVYEVGEQPLPYIVMEFIPGETLHQRLDRIGPIEAGEVVRIGRQVAEGLAAAHANDLIHRDIKPGNILLEGGAQRVKITDFGLARAADDASISQSGIIAGTPMFMAPEQAKGEKLDQRADLFSLGSVLYQMAAGRPPFRANGTLAVLKRVAEDDPRPIREVIPETPQWLCDIITKLHAKNPADRFQSAREVADVLADCEAQLTANARLKDFSRIPRGKSQRSKRRKWIAAAVVLLPAVALAAIELAGVTHLVRGPRPTAAAPNPTSDVPAPSAVPTPATFPNGVGMEFVLVPKGKAWLGGSSDRLGDKEVDVPADFYLGKYEVTQEVWRKVTGMNPSYFSRVGGGKDAVKDVPDEELGRFPVDQVSWDDCQLFIAKLNEQEKSTGWVYRLPSETEWEYACRGGPTDRAASTFDFYFAKATNTPRSDQANFGRFDFFAPTATASPQSELANSGRDGGLEKRTCKVGSFEPNGLGLFDMHGNVWEWCDDARVDAKGIRQAIRRGGNWYYGPASSTAGHSWTVEASDRSAWPGLRLVRVLDLKSAGADRKAAEFVLSVGGQVKVNENGNQITAAADLPREPFRLTGINLINDTDNLTDAHMVAFQHCRYVTALDLHANQISDAGIANFNKCKKIAELMLSSPRITDDGVIHFKDCHDLEQLSLHTSATDAGLACFNNCSKLWRLNLHDSGHISDAGLVYLKENKALRQLDLSNCGSISDAGVAHLKDCKSLEHLTLYGTRITDTGIIHLQECKSLQQLDLRRLPVTDAGVANFIRLEKLSVLHLTETRVTAAGAEGLARTLPKCKIIWDGGVIEPTARVLPTRRATEGAALIVDRGIEGSEREYSIPATSNRPMVEVDIFTSRSTVGERDLLDGGNRRGNRNHH